MGLPDHKLYTSVPTADAADVEPALMTKLDPKGASLDASTTPWYRRPRAQRLLMAAALALLAVNVISAVKVVVDYACGPPHGLDGIECLHALGGGNATNGGGFDSAIVRSPHCRRVVANYLRPGGAYWHEVDIAAGRAFDYFRAAAPTRGPNDTVVFDIDETTLSNIDDFLKAVDAACPHRRRPRHHGRPDGPPDGPDGPRDGPDGPHGPHDGHHDGHHHDHHHRHHHEEDEDEELRAVPKLLQLGAPPLPPMLRLYRFLYEQGYTVTFVTGRGEASRNQTEANLAAAGYGARCPTDPATPVLRSADGEPCWLQLDMREEGDHRLASVYKPDRRGRLVARGYTLVASFGDQFSDLEGENAAEASFKLPNPMYYIL